MALVITGTLDRCSRDEAKAAVEERGGNVTGSVSGTTTAVVAGDSPGGSKMNKATQLGVTSLDEQQFFDLLESGPSTLPAT